MIPKIQPNPIEDIRTYASATSHAFYEENAPVLLDLFDRSLLAHEGKYSPLKVQVELLQNILLSDRARKAYERDKQRYRRAVSALVKGEAPQERIKLGSDRLREANDGLISARWLAKRNGVATAGSR